MNNHFKCQCPHCGLCIEFDGVDAGREAKCPQCQKPVHLPVPTAKLIQSEHQTSPPVQPQTIYVKEKPKTGCLTQAIAVLLILLLIGFVVSVLNESHPSDLSAPSKPASKHKTVNAEIRFTDMKMVIKNIDSEDWPLVSIYVNSDPPFGYHYTVGPVPPGRPFQISLNDFIKDNGERFNPFANKIVKVWIGGGDYDYEAYGF